MNIHSEGNLAGKLAVAIMITCSIPGCTNSGEERKNAKPSSEHSVPKNFSLKKLGLLGKCEWCVGALAFSPDGKRLITGSGTRGSFGPSGDFTVWDVEKRKRICIRKVDRSYKSLVVTPGGKYLVAMDRFYIDLWQMDGIKLVSSLQGDMWLNIALSPDGETLAAIRGGSCVDIIDMKQFKPVRKLMTSPILATLQGNMLVPDGFIVLEDTPLAMAPNGAIVDGDSVIGTSYVLFSADGKVLFANKEMWDTSTWQKIAEKQWPQLTISHRQLTAAQAAWSRQSNEILAKTHKSRGATVSFSPDGVTLATGGSHISEGKIILWRCNK